MKAKATLALLLLSFAFLSPAHADHPMKNARAQAANALNVLKNNATTDKGGHRQMAMKHLAAAIAEIDAGIAFDQNNVTANEGKKRKKN